eukprot:Sspe_Gene.112640::Locus_95777_Transcript_1_1_Confidence_1.000_Length_768::g.112640::m.112640
MISADERASRASTVGTDVPVRQSILARIPLSWRILLISSSMHILAGLAVYLVHTQAFQGSDDVGDQATALSIVVVTIVLAMACLYYSLRPLRHLIDGCEAFKKVVDSNEDDSIILPYLKDFYEGWPQDLQMVVDAWDSMVMLINSLDNPTPKSNLELLSYLNQEGSDDDTLIGDSDITMSRMHTTAHNYTGTGTGTGT